MNGDLEDMTLAELIRKATTEALLDVGVTEAKFAVEWPGDLAHGDYATNAAMAAAKSVGKNPRELAMELVPLISKKLGEYTSNGNFATSVELAGPGFINITLSPETISAHIEQANSMGLAWGTSQENDGKRIIVEFSCPNPFKEMHIGHLMSTIIGESIARLIESSGATVARDSYGGDVGPHVAKAIWALQRANVIDPTSAEEIGNAYAHGSRAYEESEEAKAEIDALNTKIYKGDDHALMELWRKGREISLEAFRDIYRQLNTHFDYYFFESETGPIGMDIVKDGLEKGVFEESEGAIIYNGERKGLHTLVFVTSRGTPTYEAKDMGLAFLKEERWPSDTSLIITAAEQVGHFKVFLAALADVAPHLAAKTHHVPHGFLRLATGKMSSREGNVITAESLIRTVIEKTLERNPDPLIAEQVALGAIKFSILRSSAGSDIIFDFDSSLSLDGESGPYLQYATVRAKSVLANAENNKEQKIKEDSGEKIVDEATDQSEARKSYAIERLIIRFPEVVRASEKNLAPHTVAQYLTQLASEWNSFYAQERIIGSADEARKLEIARAFITTMENGLRLLGISVPEKM